MERRASVLGVSNRFLQSYSLTKGSFGSVETPFGVGISVRPESSFLINSMTETRPETVCPTLTVPDVLLKAREATRFLERMGSGIVSFRVSNEKYERETDDRGDDLLPSAVSIFRRLELEVLRRSTSQRHSLVHPLLGRERFGECLDRLSGWCPFERDPAL
jgi:hypothetical protein